VKAYYHRRAPEYDHWYLGTGLYEDRDRPNWQAELEELTRTIASLSPLRTLDVACGTGFLTQHLPGEVVGLDASEAMIDISRQRVPGMTFVVGDALDLPFGDGAFDRVFTGHFFGHLEDADRRRFLVEARRVARELVVADSSQAHSPVAEEYQPRVLNDGSRWDVYKRYFTGAGLAAELGGGSVLCENRWFVVVRSP
jgi:ubiquinone/menaquinone biosynthesis C-methylase UbiE